MNRLDDKINKFFPGLVVRKDLVKTVKGNAIVPSYVLEYLLGQYCATNDEATIQAGIETVKDILGKHYVHRNEAGLVRSNIKQRGRYKVIDKIFVALNDKKDAYEASFSNLGIKQVLVDTQTIKNHPKLLVSGVWCIADISYEFEEAANVVPWVMTALKPIQLSHFDYDFFIQARQNFTTEEWIDLLTQSIGFNPQQFGTRSKLLQLVRLIPYCERNYNLIELGPKGTGKSHIYSEFSPHGILISGGEVTVPKLFVNNATGRIGLVGYWDTVAFDEFAGKSKRADKALVDILKNYMANKSFSRGIETLGAEASMVFVGNTQHTVSFMLKHADLFDDLPPQYHDSAFLDRLHFFIPGWEVDVIRSEMFSHGYGFVVDYLAEALRYLRNLDFSDKFQDYFDLSSEISTRDREGITKTFSGLMKIIFPHGQASKEEAETLLKFAVEGRKRVKDQLMRIDSTFPDAYFFYQTDHDKLWVKTLEEAQYPQHYHKNLPVDGEDQAMAVDIPSPQPVNHDQEPQPAADHLVFQENQKGVSFDQLFGPYLQNATHITITDPYIRLFYQIRNLMEFLETVVKVKQDDQEVVVHLVTLEDDFKSVQQREYLDKIVENSRAVGVQFSYEFSQDSGLHARHITTNDGWKILLDRGLDIFQPYEMNDAFTFANRLQQYRSCKAFEITYIKATE